MGRWRRWNATFKASSASMARNAGLTGRRLPSLPRSVRQRSTFPRRAERSFDSPRVVGNGEADVNLVNPVQFLDMINRIINKNLRDRLSSPFPPVQKFVEIQAFLADAPLAQRRNSGSSRN